MEMSYLAKTFNLAIRSFEKGWESDDLVFLPSIAEVAKAPKVEMDAK